MYTSNNTDKSHISTCECLLTRLFDQYIRRITFVPIAGFGLINTPLSTWLRYYSYSITMSTTFNK